jgi:hypothetical protein
MDITKTRVNIEEAIAAIQAVTHLVLLDWNDIDWYSNGIPVKLVDCSYPNEKDFPPFGIDPIHYITRCDYVITPKTEEILEDE